jgi:hypothetical protein
MLTALLLSASLLAEPLTVELHYMPPGTSLELPTKEEVKYYTFEEYKKLLRMDYELWLLTQQIEDFKKLEDSHAKQVTQLDLVVTTLNNDKATLNARLKRTEQNWHDAEKRAVEAAGGSTWPYIVAGGGAVVGIVGTVLYFVSLSNSK